MVRTIVIKKFMMLSLFAPRNKSYSSSSLEPASKGRQEEIKFTFDVSKCDRIFDELLKPGNIKLTHTILQLKS
jgi:hypothetical protein